MTSQPVLPVYLVHWNAPDWCASAARSVLASEGVDVALTILDNGGSTGKELGSSLPEEARVLPLGRNTGYAGAANVGLADWLDQHPEADLCVIGSHDLHVEPDTFAKLVEVARAHPDAGIIAPALVGPKSSFGGTWDGSRSHLVRTRPGETVVDRDWASGTCLLLRRRCVDEVGDFEDRFGSYVEDVDYGLRAHDAGWRVLVVSTAHAHGLGTGSAEAWGLSAANMVLLSKKRGGGRGALMASARLLVDIARGYGASVRRRHDPRLRMLLRHRATQRLMSLLGLLATDRLAGISSDVKSGERRPPAGGPRLHVLFVSHEAGRSGAVFVLLRLVRWLRANTDLECTVLFGTDGPMVAEFAMLCPVVCLPRATPILGGVARRLHPDPTRDVVRWARSRHLARSLQHVDVLYSNTLSNGTTLRFLQMMDKPLITHVHELDNGINQRVSDDDWELFERSTTHYIAVSEAVRRALVRLRSVPEDKIITVHPFLEVAPGASPPPEELRSAARQALDLPADAFVVGGAGRTDWFKAADLFVAVAKLVREQVDDRPIRFAWIGPAKGSQRRQLEHDIRMAGLDGCVRLMGERVDTPDCFAAFDVLALTSREDAYPLVVLEAAMHAVPTVCFDEGGGAPEFVEGGAGVVVPYLDLADFSKQLARLSRDVDRCRELGRQAFHKLTTTHSVDALAPRILEVLFDTSGWTARANHAL